MFNLKRKVLFGLSVSMVLAMAIGSFALSESQTPASPRAAEAQSLVGATAGPFTVEGGTQGTDYDYASSVLTIHSGNLTISTSAETNERIVVDGAVTITLAGVNIDRSSITTNEPAALTITDNANFDVKILLADNTTNILKGANGDPAGTPGSPGIQKNGEGASIGTLTIGVPDGSAGTGRLEATGGSRTAGIGGGGYGNGNGSDITITGGEVTANGGRHAAGIGGGISGNGNDITISGGKVTANGGFMAAGIGGGNGGSGSDITISGGVVTAYGGSDSYGIGDGYSPSTSGSGNSLNGDAVVLATSGSASKDALEGFVDGQGGSLLTQGIVFTGLGTAFDSDGIATDITWDSNGTMYGNVTLSQDLEIPANLTVPAGQILSIKEDKDVTLSEKTGVKYTVEGELRNNGIVTLPSDLEVNAEGKVTTALTYDAQDGRIANADEYKTYQDSNEVKAYSELPNAEKDNCIFEGWYTGKDGEGTKIEETSLVLLNQHILYANWTANPEPIPDPSIDPGHGGDGSDASSKTGDSFAGIAALAILGLATTGAVMLRKRK